MESTQGDTGNANWDDQTLAEPEISGLWNKDYKSHQVPAFICRSRLRLDGRLRLPGALPAPSPGQAWPTAAVPRTLPAAQLPPSPKPPLSAPRASVGTAAPALAPASVVGHTQRDSVRGSRVGTIPNFILLGLRETCFQKRAHIQHFLQEPFPRKTLRPEHWSSRGGGLLRTGRRAGAPPRDSEGSKAPGLLAGVSTCPPSQGPEWTLRTWIEGTRDRPRARVGEAAGETWLPVELLESCFPGW